MSTNPPKLTVTRRFRATLEEVWELWTTKEGIEAWWGPEGFAVKVHALELRPGGVLRYAMTATAAPQIAFMEQAGMPLTTITSLTFTEVEAPTRLAYVNHVDFVPGVATYPVATRLDLRQEGDEVVMLLTLDPMHDAAWSERMRMGWESEVDKLGALLRARRTA